MKEKAFLMASNPYFKGSKKFHGYLWKKLKTIRTSTVNRNWWQGNNISGISDFMEGLKGSNRAVFCPLTLSTIEDIMF